MTAGDRVKLYCPENERLHGAAAVVLTVTSYGAIVATAAAASGQFRALASEMVPAAVEGGAAFTGNCCGVCGSSRMIRNGSCELCLACGETSGCS